MSEWAEIKKDDLTNAIRILEMVPQKAGIPSSDYTRIRMGATQLELSLASSVLAMVRFPCRNKAAGEMFVDRKLLVPFVQMGRHWKGDFRSQFTGSKWRLRQGSRKADLSMREEPVTGYGNWVDHSKLEEVQLSEEMRKMLLASQACSTADPSLPHLNCVYIGGQLVMASNQTVVFIGSSIKKNEIRIPFPVGVIPLLGDGLVRGIGVDGGTVVLDCGSGYIEGTVSAVALKEFPRKSVIEQINDARKYPLLVRLPAERLAKMMQRLMVYLTAVKREDWTLRLELADERARATVRIQQGVFEESMEVEDMKAEGSLEWPLELVKPVIEYIATKAETIKIRVDEKKKTPYLLSGAGIDLLVGRRE